MRGAAGEVAGGADGGVEAGGAWAARASSGTRQTAAAARRAEREERGMGPAFGEGSGLRRADGLQNNCAIKGSSTGGRM